MFLHGGSSVGLILYIQDDDLQISGETFMLWRKFSTFSCAEVPEIGNISLETCSFDQPYLCNLFSKPVKYRY